MNAYFKHGLILLSSAVLLIAIVWAVPMPVENAAAMKNIRFGYPFPFLSQDVSDIGSGLPAFSRYVHFDRLRTVTDVSPLNAVASLLTWFAVFEALIGMLEFAKGRMFDRSASVSEGWLETVRKRFGRVGVGKRAAGFTLIELLIVIAIIGILVTAIIASVMSARDKAKDSSFKETATSIQRSMIFCCGFSGSNLGNTPGGVMCPGGGMFPGPAAIGSISAENCNLNNTFTKTLTPGSNNHGTCVNAIINQDGVTYTGC